MLRLYWCGPLDIESGWMWTPEPKWLFHLWFIDYWFLKNIVELQTVLFLALTASSTLTPLSTPTMHVCRGSVCCCMLVILAELIFPSSKVFILEYILLRLLTVVDSFTVDIDLCMARWWENCSCSVWHKVKLLACLASTAPQFSLIYQASPLEVWEKTLLTWMNVWISPLIVKLV